MLRFVLPLLVLVGCTTGTPVDLENVGRACLVPAGVEYDSPDLENAEFEYADGKLILDAVLDNCASSCTEDLVVGCEVTLEGDTLHVETWASYVQSDDVCDLLCNALQTTCEVPDLEPGTYEVEMGATSATIEIPSTVPTVCVEQYGA